MRFALAHQNPLVATRVTGGVGAPLPEDQYALLTLGSDDVLLWSLKPSEEGIDAGLIARVWNLAEGTSAMALSLPPHSLASASAATHVETDLAPVVLNGGVL
ncbi:MAG: glycoside hydrolase, partial [Candidatus Eisenbacteria bacterium]|nr:glycoside hydrolase [Candidatus Eisenbacteria bacterium]